MLFASLLRPSSSLGQRVKYRHCTYQVSPENYRQHINNPKYSPVAAGVLNFVFLAAGYLYVGEPSWAVGCANVSVLMSLGRNL
jgi:hypothetical protein